MSRDELIRATVAVPVAMLLPLSITALQHRAIRMVAVGTLVTAALAPHLGDWRAWLVVVGTVVATAIPKSYSPKTPALPLVCAVVATMWAAGVVDLGLAWQALQSAGGDRDVVLVVAGGLAAVFISGVLIGRVLGVFARAIPHHAVGMENAGRYIGWLERALLYALFVAGAPDAAALVIAGKSVARFPSFAEEEFAEYYLIGSFLSLGVAAGLGMAVRASIGLHPLVPTRV